MRPVFFKTFGCKVNYAESVGAALRLGATGITARELTGARLPEGTGECTVVVNSCCVTREAERKALQFVRRMARDYPRARVLFTGCAARHGEIKQRFNAAGAEVVADYAGVLELIGTGETSAVEELGYHGPAFTASRTRAFVKVQDGCVCRCAYCIIPDVRPYTTRPLSAVLAEVRRLCDAGCRELVLTGTNAGRYGHAPLEDVPGASHPAGGLNLTGLIEAVLAVLPAGVRLRLSSVEPLDVDAGLAGFLDHPRFCPHLHLPLQSGSDAVLKAMRRPYTAARYLEVVDGIRSAYPDVAVTTDILVGFPTETEEDFALTLALCDRAGFERVHGFPFSPRPGTPAAGLKLLPGNTVRDRNRRLIEHAATVADARWARFRGKVCEVLVEERVDGAWSGHGPAYQVVRLPGDTPGVEPGAVVPVLLGKCRGGIFSGTPA